MDTSKYSDCGIDVRWKDYSGYPMYLDLIIKYKHVNIMDDIKIPFPGDII